MSTYESQRLRNIEENQRLISDLGIQLKNEEPSRPPPVKKRKIEKPKLVASRSSARIAAAPQSSYKTSSPSPPPNGRSQRRPKGASAGITPAPVKSSKGEKLDPEALSSSWAAWTPNAPPPVRGEDGVFHFVSHPIFIPNKSPAEILREGAFGGSYFRPLRSAKLGVTVSDDWRELPSEWIEALRVERYLTSPDYDASVNKFGVACGQSIEEWEAQGWIAHEFDVRGWFQWYCRFFQGRRCVDDERQVGRWARCVGETGRWRRTLLKKYKLAGVRTVWDDGEDDDESDGKVVKKLSPVVHQTCHHWAWGKTFLPPHPYS